MNRENKILSDIIVHTKYAKYLPSEYRRETWTELVDRNKQMHIDKYPHLEDEINEAYKLVYAKKVMPSMRSFQFAGKPISLANNRLFNCCYMPIDDPKAFSETMFLLLGGSGVGYSVQEHHVAKLPFLLGDIKPVGQQRKKRYLVGDSIEGWADAVKILVESYFQGKREVDFDFRDVREKGALLVTSGGKAPGAEPLRLCLIKIKSIFENAIAERGRGTQLTTLEVHDIQCHIADAVLAGGIRRAAMLSMFSYGDMAMLHCKHGSWWETNPQRGRANNSVVLRRNKVTEKDFFDLWNIIKGSGSGEPGFIFTNNEEMGFNPCFTGDTIVAVSDGRNGVTIKQLAEESNGKGIFPVYSAKENGGVWSQETKNAVAFKTGTKEVLEISLSNGTKFRCTPEHRLANTQGGYVEAKDSLNICLQEFSTNIENVFVEAITFTGEVEDVYDLTVEDNHNFYILTKTDDDKFLNSSGVLVHNCVEASLDPFQMCNLCEVNMSDVTSQEDYNERAKVASFIGTLQAGYTDFHYLRDIWRSTVEDGALLGVSMTGTASKIVDTLDMKQASEIVKEENTRVANLISIKEGKRLTCGKPSGCRPSYSLTTTNTGIVTLAELMKDHNPLQQWNDMKESYEAVQDGTSNKIIKSFNNGVAPVYRITLSGQLQVESTGNHPWFVKSNGKTEINDFVATEDLQKKDMLDINVGVYKNEQAYKLPTIDLNSLKAKQDYQSVEIIQPSFMTSDLGWLLGYLWGDGCLSPHKYRLRFTDEHLYNLEKAQRIIFENFGLKGTIKKLKSENASELCVASVALYKWFIEQGVTKYNDKGMADIPLIVRKSSWKHIIAFIAGFTDADGSIVCKHKKTSNKVRSIMISQSGKYDFTRHLQNVALAVGLHFNHAHNTKGKNFQESKNMILLGSTSNCKKYAIEEFARHSEKSKRNFTELEFRHEENSKRIHKIGRVEKVELIGEMPTYDVQVENDPWFYAGAIKSHNTSSIVLGTSSGIHSWFAPYYIRRVRLNKNEAIYKYLAKEHPELVVDEVYAPETTAVLEVPQKAPDSAICRDEESPLDLLERVKRVSEDWIQPGHRTGHNPHNQSVTVSIKDEEWESTRDWLWEHRELYSGVSVLPFDGGTYQQTPFEEITKEEYEKRAKHLTDIDLTMVVEMQDNTDLTGELACSGGSCELK